MKTAKRTRNADRSREAILDAAERLFADHGYEATSLQLVGDEAGVSRATPGYFFGSKEGLYEAVFDRAFTRVEEILHAAYAAADEVDPQEAVARIVAAYLSIPRQFVRLGDREALRGGKAIQEIEPRLSQLHSSLERLASLTGSRLKPVPPRMLLICIVALAWWPISHSDTMLPALGFDIADPEFQAEYANFVTDLLLHGLARDR